MANGIILWISSTMSLMTKWIRSAVLEKLCISRFTTVVELLIFVVISSRFFNRRGKLLFKVSKVIAISLAVRHICKRMGIQKITSRRRAMPNIIKTISRYMDFLLIPVLNQRAFIVAHHSLRLFSFFFPISIDSRINRVFQSVFIVLNLLGAVRSEFTYFSFYFVNFFFCR